MIRKASSLQQEEGLQFNELIKIPELLIHILKEHLDRHGKSVGHDSRYIDLQQKREVNRYFRDSVDKGVIPEVKYITVRMMMFLPPGEIMKFSGLRYFPREVRFGIELESLERFNSLKVLNLNNIYGKKNLSSSIQNMTNLRMLTLHAGKNSLCLEEDDVCLRNLPRLKHLNLDDCNYITDKTIPYLSSTLTSIGLSSNYSITDSGLTLLTNLYELDLSYNRTISDSALSQMTSLKILTLDGNRKITDAGLAPLTGLERLDLNFNDTITACSVSRLTGLRVLYLNVESVLEMDVVERLTNLVSLVSTTRRLKGRYLLGLKKLTHLSILNIDSGKIIQEEDWREMTQLRWLECPCYGHNTHNATFNGLQYLTNLTNLDLGCVQGYESSLTRLTNLTALATDTILSQEIYLSLPKLREIISPTNILSPSLSNITELQMTCSTIPSPAELEGMDSLKRITCNFDLESDPFQDKDALNAFMKETERRYINFELIY